jgi:tetratricopeptide (TPR) repeat protein
MKMRRAALAGLLLAAALPAVAAVNGNEKSQRLVSEGNALFMQRQYAAAADKFEAARKESPEASGPLSSFAYMLYALAAGGSNPQAKAQLERARDWAQKALALAPDDPLANEVLRGLEDDTPRPAHVPNQAASQAFDEGEVLFHQGQYEAARLKYRTAFKADPKYAKALVMEGDAYFMEKNWAGAELMFAMAAEADPLDSQAWRFLADARARQGNSQGALGAVLHAIEAMPGEIGNWERLKAAVSGSDRPMTRLGLVRKAWVQRDPSTGKLTVNLAAGLKSASESGDQTIWLAYAMAQAAGRKDGKPESPFEKELRAWDTALTVAAELEAAGKPAPEAPALLTLQKLRAAGQLEAAILLLMYRESYRADFEAWKKSHPGAIPAFTDTWRLAP